MKERPTTALGKWKRDLYPNIKYWKSFFILFSINFARGRQGILKGNRLERIESTRKTQRGSVTSRPGNKGAWFSQGSHYEGYSEEVFITGVLPQNQTKRPRKRHRKCIGPLVPSTATANASLRERSLLKRSVFASLFGSCYVLVCLLLQRNPDGENSMYNYILKSIKFHKDPADRNVHTPRN